MNTEYDSTYTLDEDISNQLSAMSTSATKSKVKKKKNAFVQMDVPVDISTKRVKKSSLSKEKKSKKTLENMDNSVTENIAIAISNELDSNSVNQNDIFSKKKSSQRVKGKNPDALTSGTMNLFDTQRTNFTYYLESNRRALLRCCSNTVLNFNGVLNIKVLQGNVRISGYSVNKRETKPIKVYSLNAYSYLPIEILQSESTNIKKNKLTKALRALDITEENIQTILTCLEPQQCLLYIENSVNSNSDQSDKVLFHMIQRLNHSIPSLLPERNYFHQSEDPAHLLEKHLNMRFFKRINSSGGAPVLMQPDSWNILYEQCIENHKSARLVLCGGSGLGKTTLLRYLINRSIQKFGKVLVLDLDPGQSEFYLPGTLSASVIHSPLLGPNFTQLRDCKPIRSYCLGDVKIHSMAHIYVQFIQALLNYCRSRHDLATLPWFVNTMGYVKDQGIGLNCRIIRETKPTHVIQIHSRKPDENFPSDLTWKFVLNNSFQSHDEVQETTELSFELKHLDSVKNKPFDNMNKSLKPADKRKLMLTAYFNPLFSTIQDEYTVNLCVPYGAKLKYLQLDMATKSGSQLSRGELLAAMNGEMVALTGGLGKNEPAHCLGYGIVYCIDSTSQELFLISPLSLSDMAAVRCLLLASPSLSLPRKFLDARCKELLGQRLPYASISKGEGQFTSQSTRRIYRQPRKSLVRAHKS